MAAYEIIMRWQMTVMLKIMTDFIEFFSFSKKKTREETNCVEWNATSLNFFNWIYFAILIPHSVWPKAVHFQIFYDFQFLKITRKKLSKWLLLVKNTTQPNSTLFLCSIAFSLGVSFFFLSLSSVRIANRVQSSCIKAKKQINKVKR